MAEGAPLLREYVVKSRIEGSNPSLSAILCPAGFGWSTPVKHPEPQPGDGMFPGALVRGIGSSPNFLPPFPPFALKPPNEGRRAELRPLWLGDSSSKFNHCNF